MPRLSNYQDDALKLAGAALNDSIRFARGEIELNATDFAERLGKALAVVRAAQQPNAGAAVRRLIRAFWTPS